MAHMRLGLVIDWDSDDNDPEEVRQQLLRDDFDIHDLMAIADKVEVIVIDVDKELARQ